MDEKEFQEKYNFDNLKMITVINPTSEDFAFSITMETSVDVTTGQMKAASKEYVIRSGAKERIPGVAANLYLDQMAKKIAQEEDKFPLYPDFAVRAKYYDDLIIRVEDVFNTSVGIDYNVAPETASDVKEEVPFASVKDNDEQPKTNTEGVDSAREEASTRTKALGSKAK